MLLNTLNISYWVENASFRLKFQSICNKAFERLLKNEWNLKVQFNVSEMLTTVLKKHLLAEYMFCCLIASNTNNLNRMNNCILRIEQFGRVNSLDLNVEKNCGILIYSILALNLRIIGRLGWRPQQLWPLQ